MVWLHSAALKQLLLDVLQARQSDLDKITQLQEQVALPAASSVADLRSAAAMELLDDF